MCKVLSDSNSEVPRANFGLCYSFTNTSSAEWMCALSIKV